MKLETEMLKYGWKYSDRVMFEGENSEKEGQTS